MCRDPGDISELLEEIGELMDRYSQGVKAGRYDRISLESMRHNKDSANMEDFPEVGGARHESQEPLQ